MFSSKTEMVEASNQPASLQLPEHLLAARQK